MKKKTIKNKILKFNSEIFLFKKSLFDIKINNKATKISYYYQLNFKNLS